MASFNNGRDIDLRQGYNVVGPDSMSMLVAMPARAPSFKEQGNKVPDRECGTALDRGGTYWYVVKHSTRGLNGLACRGTAQLSTE